MDSLDDARPGFLEEKGEVSSPVRERNRYVLSLIPYEQTTTWVHGTAGAPEAIVEASGHMELFDETLHVDASRRGVLTLRPDVPDLAAVTAHARSVRRDHPDALWGFIGGEHSITPAILEGLLEPGEDVGVVWIDAHADLRETYCGRADNHACAGRNTMRLAPIVQVGVRTLAELEFELLRRSDRVRVFPRWDASARAALRDLPRRVYLSVDFDGFAPGVIRAVGTPEPGGLDWDDGLSILEAVFADHEVFAFDAVELCPNPADPASTFTAARFVHKILAFDAAARG